LGGLKGIVKEWIKAEVKKYDIWDFDMELHEGGDVRRIKNKREVIMEDKKIHRSFSNYFGVGIDARIGYSFDKRRTQSKFGNLLCYGCIGLFKWCKKAIQLHDLVENMQ
jgi:diacylglycerol kinase (ATP)